MSPQETKAEAITTPSLLPGELTVDAKIRPSSFGEFVGQERTKKLLNRVLQAAAQREEPPEHMLLVAPPGTGKTALARIVRGDHGREINAAMDGTSSRFADAVKWALFVPNLRFIHLEELHDLPRRSQEMLYPLLEDGDFSLPGGGLFHHSKLSVVGTTTDLGRLSTPFVQRFRVYRLDEYSLSDVQTIILRAAPKLNVDIVPEAATEIALRARAIPRIANRLLRIVRDFGDPITPELAKQSLDEVGIDKHGLDLFDWKYIKFLVAHDNRASLSTLAAALGEATQTVERVYEPYLIKMGLIDRFTGGRRLLRLPS